jgi:hypothetical protein
VHSSPKWGEAVLIDTEIIVGADRKVMVFERDIRWMSFPGHRGTEKWLHDSWLAEKGHIVRQS